MQSQNTIPLPRFVDRVCQTCGKTFSALRYEVSVGKAKFCSRPCSTVAKHKDSGRQAQRTCQHCGTPFMSTVGYVANGRGKHCSLACSGASRRRDAAAFWAKVARGGEDDCWPWQGGPREGYGQTTFYGKPMLTHRLSYMLTHGPIPDGMVVCHDCDQRYPVGDMSYRRCCNPAHLFLGTVAENNADAVSKGRTARGDRSTARLHPERMEKGERRYNARMTDEMVREIRRLAQEGTMTQRAIAAQLGVTPRLVNGVIRGRSWKHVL